MKGRPGILRHRVTVQSNSPTASAYGENTDDWNTLEVVYADVEPISESESYRAGQPVGTQSYRVTMRYRGTSLGDVLTFVNGTPWTTVAGDPVLRVETGTGRVVPGYRLVYRDKNLEVTGVRDVDERHRYTVLTAVEVA